MSEAKKCDICGALHEFYNTRNSVENWNAIQFYNQVSTGGHYSHGIWDICPECQKAISDLMKARKGETV